jgi:hypothetical protein
VITFEQFAGIGYNFTNGPTQIGGLVGLDVILAAANGGAGAVLGSGGYDLGANGSWGGPKTYTGVDSAASTAFIKITFNFGPVSGVGGFVNYNPAFGTPILEALDASDNVLESYDLSLAAPISTPLGDDAGAFRGIVRPTADIAAFRLQGAFLAMDDLRFDAQAAVPEPSTWVMMIGAFGVVCLLNRTRAFRT